METLKHLNTQTPNRFLFPMNDQAIVSGQNISDMLIHCVISFDGQIDPERMEKAVKLSFEAEPIVGCRLVWGWWRICWERNNVSDYSEIFNVLASQDIEADMIRFLTTPADPCNAPLIQILLLRSETDTLCIKVSHAISDAGGVKSYAYLLASIYQKLAGDPEYKLRPNLNRIRSMRQVSRLFGLSDKLRIIRRTFRELKTGFFPLKSCTFPLVKGVLDDRTFLIRRIPPERFCAIQSYARQYNATINDMMLTAIFRAFLKIIRPQADVPMRLITTADFRKHHLHAENAGTLCNLSGIYYLKMSRDPEAGFNESLLQVREQMKFIKRDFIGLGYHPVFVIPSMIIPDAWNQRLGKVIGYFFLNCWKNNPPAFTNMGKIDTEQLVFGDARVSDAFLTAPVMFPPLFLIGFSGFGESVTMSSGFCNAAVNKPLAERVFNYVEWELVHAAGRR
jgi:NRPS condensation-like uncharacterized protein